MKNKKLIIGGAVAALVFVGYILSKKESLPKNWVQRDTSNDLY